VDRNRRRLVVAVWTGCIAAGVILGSIAGAWYRTPSALPDELFTPLLPRSTPTPTPTPAALFAVRYGLPSASDAPETPEELLRTFTPSPSPTPERVAKVKTMTAPRPRTTLKTKSQMTGKASWHATGRSGWYAAACRPLRRAMGSGWRGEQVLVSYGKRALVVTISDYCASRTKAIDLSDEAFAYLSRGHLSRGVLPVTIDWP
jgi:hypothetical protein